MVLGFINTNCTLCLCLFVLPTPAPSPAPMATATATPLAGRAAKYRISSFVKVEPLICAQVAATNGQLGSWQHASCHSLVWHVIHYEPHPAVTLTAPREGADRGTGGRLYKTLVAQLFTLATRRRDNGSATNSSNFKPICLLVLAPRHSKCKLAGGAAGARRIMQLK